MINQINEVLGGEYTPISGLEGINKFSDLIYQNKIFRFNQKFGGDYIFRNGKERITINPKKAIGKIWVIT